MRKGEKWLIRRRGRRQTGRQREAWDRNAGLLAKANLSISDMI